MCHESTNQMNEILAGSKPTNLTKGLKLLAMNQDKNFDSVDKNFIKVDKKFELVDVKLDLILKTIQDNKIDTDKNINTIKTNQDNYCKEHRKELAVKFKQIDDNTEVVSFFSTHPKLLLIIGLGLIFLIGFAFGHNKILELFKVV